MMHNDRLISINHSSVTTYFSCRDKRKRKERQFASRDGERRAVEFAEVHLSHSPCFSEETTAALITTFICQRQLAARGSFHGHSASRLPQPRREYVATRLLPSLRVQLTSRRKSDGEKRRNIDWCATVRRGVRSIFDTSGSETTQLRMQH